MKLVCPFCSWPEFTVFRPIEKAGSDWRGLRFRKVGKIVVCARCTEQYAIGEVGAYKIAPGRAEPAPVEHGQPRPAVPVSLVDEDQAKLW